MFKSFQKITLKNRKNFQRIILNKITPYEKEELRPKRRLVIANSIFFSFVVIYLVLWSLAYFLMNDNIATANDYILNSKTYNTVAIADNAKFTAWTNAYLQWLSTHKTASHESIINHYNAYVLQCQTLTSGLVNAYKTVSPAAFALLKPSLFMFYTAMYSFVIIYLLTIIILSVITYFYSNDHYLEKGMKIITFFKFADTIILLLFGALFITFLSDPVFIPTSAKWSFWTCDQAINSTNFDLVFLNGMSMNVHSWDLANTGTNVAQYYNGACVGYLLTGHFQHVANIGQNIIQHNVTAFNKTPNVTTGELSQLIANNQRLVPWFTFSY